LAIFLSSLTGKVDVTRPYGSLRYPWGAESRAACCRFDMSFCLVHDMLSQLGGIEL
jgi:hypothetical protein